MFSLPPAPRPRRDLELLAATRQLLSGDADTNTDRVAELTNPKVKAWCNNIRLTKPKGSIWF